jgi:predicted DNA-binding protein
MKKYIYMKKNKTKIKEKRNEKITKMENFYLSVIVERKIQSSRLTITTGCAT